MADRLRCPRCGEGRDYGKWLLAGLLALVAAVIVLPYFGVY